TYVGALPGGSQRQANLDQFVNSADNYDSTYNGSLVRFLKYTDYIRQSGDGEVAQLLGENDDVVRMMSVHKSKGLEFRVVFGMQLGKHYKDEKSNAPLVAHHTLGIGMSYFDPVLRTRRLTLPQAAIMARRYREDKAEEMRILYVMLTRAKDHLVLVGTVKDIERSMRNWNALAAAPFASGSHLDLIMAARCWAEKAGEDLHSELTVISAESIRIKENETTEVCNAPMRNVLSGIQANTDVGMYNRLAWSYPDPISVGKPMKLTASGLLRELEGPEEIPVLMDRPSFLAFDASHMTGAERGSAYHRCLQLLAFESLKGLSSNDLEREVANQLDRYTDRRLLQANQREAVRIDQITKFLQSDVGLRLRRAQVVKREWPFNVKMRISEALTPQEAGRFGSEELLVQGIIDCCFMEGGQWVLLDYKTDRTSDLNALREHYRRQLAVYAHALFLITGISVKERLLCLLESGQTLAV
ncbi:MAG: PD-(D/E)XK nuclease family protein, partial [Clostridia bacterium]|nr:PD-(D/E)XK nuclease family protein [Clostridia bacterium]